MSEHVCLYLYIMWGSGQAYSTVLDVGPEEEGCVLFMYIFAEAAQPSG